MTAIPESELEKAAAEEKRQFPGDNIREFLENVNARWGDIDEALTWFKANRESIASIVKAAGKIAAFVDVLLKKENADEK